MRATTPLGFQDGAGAAAHAKARLTHWRTMLVVFVGSSSSTLASMMRVATMVIWRASALPPSAERSCERWTADGVSSLSACVEQRCRSVHTHTREMMRLMTTPRRRTIEDKGKQHCYIAHCCRVQHTQTTSAAAQRTSGAPDPTIIARTRPRRPHTKRKPPPFRCPALWAWCGPLVYVRGAPSPRPLVMRVAVSRRDGFFVATGRVVRHPQQVARPISLACLCRLSPRSPWLSYYSPTSVRCGAAAAAAAATAAAAVAAAAALRQSPCAGTSGGRGYRPRPARPGCAARSAASRRRAPARAR